MRPTKRGAETVPPCLSGPSRPKTRRRRRVPMREPPMPARVAALLAAPPAAPEIQRLHAWNPNDRSRNILVKQDALTVHRQPVLQITDCIRGRMGYSNGLHSWEVMWPSDQRGTHAVVGVATADAPLISDGYLNLVGGNDQSWGWDLVRNKMFHNAQTASDGRSYTPLLRPEGDLPVPDNVTVVLDMDEGTLAFLAEGLYLGIAARGLRGKTLYPIVSAVWGHAEITMKYINGFEPAPLSLMELSRCAIRQSIGTARLRAAGRRLPLPTKLIAYLQYREC